MTTEKSTFVDKVEGMQRNRSLIANTLTLTLLGGILYAVFLKFNTWAVATFAQAILASALLAVCDVAIFFIALALAPPVSRFWYFLLYRKTPLKSISARMSSR